MFDHVYFMKEALKEAQKAFQKDEVPIGAVVVHHNKIIARSHNLTETLHDVTAHAEMQAITAAANALGGKYLDECTLYVSLEPCPMCASACYWAHLGSMVYGADDEKMGAESKQLSLFHPKTQIIKGILGKESAQLIQLFFKNKRK